MTMTKGEPPTGGPADRAREAQPRAGRRVGAAPRRSSRRARTCSATCGRASGPRIGADALMEALIRQGTDVLFSYPGGVILPIYDILGDYPEIRHILVRHEQGGGHAADGYARASGRVGVCMGTSGPGRDQPRHRDRHGAAGLGPDGRDHRQRARRADRQGRVPGDRHHRHHAADDQAQLPGPERRRHPARRRRGVPPRPLRPARAPSTSTSPRTPCSRRRAPSTPPSTTSSPACPASARPSTATPSSSSWRPGRSPRPSGR